MNKHVQLLCLLVVGMSSVPAWSRLPTEAQCQVVARTVLAHRLAGDCQSVRLKTQTHVQLGDRLVRMAEEERETTAKLVLLREAFGQYVQDGEFDKADGIYARARAEQGAEYAVRLACPASPSLYELALREWRAEADPPVTPAVIKVDLSSSVSLELVGCPPGTFMMGREGVTDSKSNERLHRVNITRPFWMSRYKVTLKVWNAYKPRKDRTLAPTDVVQGGWNRIMDPTAAEVENFFKWLNPRFRAKRAIPPGYTLRLPTEAEWEYALNANATDEADLYVQYRKGKLRNVAPLVVSCHELRVRDRNGVLTDRDHWIWSFEAGTKRPNRWGFHDMLGSGNELTLDSVDLNVPDPVVYAEEETDPLRFFPGATRRHIVRNRGHYGLYWCHSWSNKDFVPSNGKVVFHVLLGPDLLKERNIRPENWK